MEITFTHPQFLILLFVIPLFILIHFIGIKTRKKNALVFANFDAIARIKGIDFFSKNMGALFLSIVVAALLVLSVSGMTIHRSMSSSSFSFILAIDVSKSMEAQDLVPNRLEAAKEFAEKFVENAPYGTRMGIVSFSGNAFIEQEMTSDKTQLESAISNIQISNIEGTDISEVLVTSTNLLRDEGVRAIVLLSDGMLNTGTIQEGIDYAKKYDVVVDSAAVGTSEGGKVYYGVSNVDKDALKSLAYNTGGNFFEVSNSTYFSKLPNDVFKLTMKNVSTDLSFYLSIAALIVFAAEFVLLNLRYRSII